MAAEEYPVREYSRLMPPEVGAGVVCVGGGASPSVGGADCVRTPTGGGASGGAENDVVVGTVVGGGGGGPPPPKSGGPDTGPVLIPGPGGGGT